MIALLQSSLDLAGLITDCILIDEFESGFAAMISGEADKVVVDRG